MLRLLYTDLKRIVKDKLFLIVCIIGAAFSIITPLIYFAIFSVLGDMSDMELLGFGFTGKTMYFSCFSPGNNFGIILPVFISIIIFKDFSYGTIRNKIISGNSRTSIFISLFLASFISLTCVILAHALLSLGFSLLFTSYQATPFDTKALIYLLESTGFVILGYLFISALISFLSVSMKNMGLTIVSIIAIFMVFVIISSILQVGIIVLDTEENKTIVNVLRFLNNINTFNSLTSVIGYGEAYSLKDALYLIISPLVTSGCLGGLGLLVMNKKEIK